MTSVSDPPAEQSAATASSAATATATATAAPPAAIFSPLHDVHVAAGASFTDFAGWQMPVRYSSDLAEHHAVRTAAGLFDLSHMAEFEVSGPDAAAFLDHALAGRLSAIAIGQAKYSLILTDDAGIVDDIVVYRTGEQQFLVVANAGNHAPALEALEQRAAGFDVSVVDTSDAVALIAVQGPRSVEIVEAVLSQHPLADLGYYRAHAAAHNDTPVYIARTGYTGEDGFEVYVPVADAPALWADLVRVGGPLGLVPAGLASRDTLRLEAGMPLYGHELGLETRPAQAGLGKVPVMGKATFVGKAALEAPTDPNARVLVGLTGEGKRAARADYEIFDDETSTTPIGVVTSGVLSPTLGVPIAMAYLDPAFAEVGTGVTIDVRGKRLAFSVTPLPFYRRKRD